MTKKDKTKDLFYNAIDYLVMLVIIIGVVIILGWKFEMLFNKSATDDNEIVENNTEEDVKPTESDTVTKDISEVDKIDKEQSENTENTENPNETEVTTDENTDAENTDENGATDTEQPTETETTDTETTENETTVETDTKPAENAGAEVTINIPAGTLPGATGQILADNGIVESSEAFVKKAVELGLDRKLKSGEFKLTKGMSLDAVVKAIAKQ